MAAPPPELPAGCRPDRRRRGEGRRFLRGLPAECAAAAFFDPQYRGVLDRLRYGNEGKGRGRGRSALAQMSEEVIVEFIAGLARVLRPSGHLFLWIDKFHLCAGDAQKWAADTPLRQVDMVTWDKGRMGMGYRTRRQVEHLAVLQKKPLRAKGVWSARDIPDVIAERVPRGGHPHRKPVGMQRRLIEAVSAPGDLIVDPAAGSYSVLESCQLAGRTFIGCDLAG